MLPGVAGAATPADAKSRFAEARVAFEAEDFSRALQLFEECLDLGMQGPAVHYNVGVAAYKMGNLARAEQAFHEVAKTPAMAALAHYNLGLVAQQRNDPRGAREWFERAKAESTDERITLLATRQLDALPHEPPPSQWSAYARGGIGYDDNVALRSQSIDTPGTGESDSFAVLLAAGSYTFQEHWRIDAAAGLSRYAELDEFDQTVIEVAGHTDSTGTNEYNQQLSERRAGSVASYLKTREILPERIIQVGVGEDRPIADNATDSGRQANRRVELTLVPLTLS